MKSISGRKAEVREMEEDFAPSPRHFSVFQILPVGLKFVLPIHNEGFWF